MEIAGNYKNYLKGYCVIRHINSFGPKNVGNVKYIPSSSSIDSNLYQHQFALSKWQVGNITNLKAALVRNWTLKESHHKSLERPKFMNPSRRPPHS